ncbi:MAG: cytochrome-c peroxidase [Bacteroidetes bacterium]|nr:cytochrome-c peroxidase [Bacteroidota bacterium]
MKRLVQQLPLSAIFFIVLFGQSCHKKDKPTPAQGPTAYSLDIPGNWQKPNILADNPLTVEGVQLGRKLFYDENLSLNRTQACADCHQQAYGFTDAGNAVSKGSEGILGTRNAMTLANLNWNSGYFWNGRQPTLESLVQEPMGAPHEMNLAIDVAVERLKDDPDYPALFNKAFPNQGITTVTLRYAIAQFLRTIISGGNTKYDEYFNKNPRAPETYMTPQEKRGYEAFIDEKRGDCFHCHSPINPLFSNQNEREFVNNALDVQPDSGRFLVTGISNDFGKFKTPSLRNLAFTAPYMHDGRFQTLDEVLEHYNSGIKYSETVDPVLIKHMDADNNFAPVPRLTQQDKDDIIAFLMLLTDSNLVTNPKWSKPN